MPPPSPIFPGVAAGTIYCLAFMNSQGAASLVRRRLLNWDFDMAAPLMPKATAVWLVENTSLTFEQIADFCGLHPLEVQAIADGEVANQMQGLDPVANGQTTAEEIERCQADPAGAAQAVAAGAPAADFRHKGPRYTPIAKRQDKPDAIAYLLEAIPNCPTRRSRS